MTSITVDSAILIEKYNKEIDKKRQEAYEKESDSLFFKAQRNEIPITDWENKVAEIKARFPKK
jgi:hypothetical protein